MLIRLDQECMLFCLGIYFKLIYIIATRRIRTGILLVTRPDYFLIALHIISRSYLGDRNMTYDVVMHENAVIMRL